VGADLAAMIGAHVDGDDSALETLVHRFTPMMRGVARRHVRDAPDVDDAVQDAWIAFSRHAEAIRSPDALPGWLRVTTARCAITISKRSRCCAPGSFDAVLERSAPVLDDVRFDDDDRRLVREAVGRLGASDRELLGLLFDAELTYVEVVSRTGRPVGSIGPTRKRVLGRLRRDRAIRSISLERTG
jgi:RNA polymerase sigma factor (sigma-70 family)